MLNHIDSTQQNRPKCLLSFCCSSNHLQLLKIYSKWKTFFTKTKVQWSSERFEAKKLKIASIDVWDVHSWTLWPKIRIEERRKSATKTIYLPNVTNKNRFRRVLYRLFLRWRPNWSFAREKKEERRISSKFHFDSLFLTFSKLFSSPDRRKIPLANRSKRRRRLVDRIPIEISRQSPKQRLHRTNEP